MAVWAVLNADTFQFVGKVTVSVPGDRNAEGLEAIRQASMMAQQDGSMMAVPAAAAVRGTASLTVNPDVTVTPG